MPLNAQALKHVPKWAWYTSAGVGIGATVLYVVRNRGDSTPADATTLTEDGTAVTGSPDAFSPSPVPGIVVPNVVVGDTGSGQTSQGVLELHNMYMEGLRDVLDSMGSVATLAAPVTPTIPDTLNVVLTGGGVPSTARTGTTVVQPPNPQKKCCLYHGHPLSYWRKQKKGGKFKWPGDATYKRPHEFRGNLKCDGGGTAPGTKKEC
jgi:hypothetical protein